MIRISRASDADLDPQISAVVRNLLNDAFEGDFSEEDWKHTFGGMRFLGFLNDQLIAHGAVVPRKIEVDESDLIIGYVEGIAVAPTYWHKGYGSLLMAEITSYCLSEFSLSMLSTSEK
ncbi:GNAT family N-acetyltransferase, partial [bacterium]|nr:GNAT family N-acetyltransferase [bacterium]